MEGRIPEESLLDRLKQAADPRRRQGKVYPLWSLLGMLILAALNGESSLRGMWLWSCDHWALISRPSGFTGQRHPPDHGERSNHHSGGFLFWRVLKVATPEQYQ